MSLAGTKQYQMPALAHARTTERCRWIFAQSMDNTGCRPPRCGASRRPRILIIRTISCVVFHPFFWRTRNTLRGSRGSSSACSRLLSTFSPQMIS